MKLPQIPQSQLNSMLSVGIVSTFLLASFAYFRKTKKRVANDWEITTDGDDMELSFKNAHTFKLKKDGTISNLSIDTLNKRLENLEVKVKTLPPQPKKPKKTNKSTSK